jgi:hypothetical protein
MLHCNRQLGHRAGSEAKGRVRIAPSAPIFEGPFRKHPPQQDIWRCLLAAFAALSFTERNVSGGDR